MTNATLSPRARDGDATEQWHCLVNAGGHKGAGQHRRSGHFKKIALAALAGFLLFGAVPAEAGIRYGDLPSDASYAANTR